MNSQSLIPEELVSDLKGLDHEYINELYSKHGALDTARLLGSRTDNHAYHKLAGRLLIHALKAKAPATVAEYVEVFKKRLNYKCYVFMRDNAEALEAGMDYSKDYEYDWFGASTLHSLYLAKTNAQGSIFERPQFLHLRIATQLYCEEGVSKVLAKYRELSTHNIVHASPTQFNAALRKHNMSSCFLMSIEDSLESILGMGVYNAGLISKYSGGLGVNIGEIRHSEIDEVGQSSGIMPMLQLYNSLIRYVDQQRKRKGACTVFLPPHHIDVELFLRLSKKNGDRYAVAHDIHTSMWTPDLFMERVRDDKDWSLVCPNKARKCFTTYGDEFTNAYLMMERDPTISKEVVKARDIMAIANKARLGSGLPYCMFSDACNRKSNQRHLGYIGGANLCQETVEYREPGEVAVCNLASINLPKLALSKVGPTCSTQELRDACDFDALAGRIRSAVENLDKVIDCNWYPLDKRDDDGNVVAHGPDHVNNLKHRPLGIGVSGFADLLYRMDMHFEHPTTRQLNKMIFACMYWNAMAKSIELAIQHGPHPSFAGSPLSEGKFQFDLWREEFELLGDNKYRSKEDDEPVDPREWGQQAYVIVFNGVHVDTIKPTWEDLRRCVMKYGARNALLISLMPTATTAHVIGNTETVEAPMSNIYSRKTIQGSYTVVNKYMIDDLKSMNLWSPLVEQFIQANDGSLANLNKFLEQIGQTVTDRSRLKYLMIKYKTMWELSQRLFLRYAADRGRYVCQSQSTNLYLAEATEAKLNAWLMEAWMMGLKTGIYYLRTKPIKEALKFTSDKRLEDEARSLKDSSDSCSEDCISCGS